MLPIFYIDNQCIKGNNELLKINYMCGLFMKNI